MTSKTIKVFDKELSLEANVSTSDDLENLKNDDEEIQSKMMDKTSHLKDKKSDLNCEGSISKSDSEKESVNEDNLGSRGTYSTL